MESDESTKFLSSQKDIVARLGALVTVLENGIGGIRNSASVAVDENAVRRLLPILNQFRIGLNPANEFFSQNGLEVFSGEILRQIVRLSTRFGEQTLPSKARNKETFCAESDQNTAALSEIMIATAKLAPPIVDLSVKAGNSFAAYVLISDLIARCADTLIIVDPYIDESLFYRYLYRAPRSIRIRVVADSRRIAGAQLTRFEAVETLFVQTYSRYERILRDNLHDRYLIVDEVAFTLGGSIKDAARTADYSVVQLSDKQRTHLNTEYA